MGPVLQRRHPERLRDDIDVVAVLHLRHLLDERRVREHQTESGAGQAVTLRERSQDDDVGVRRQVRQEAGVGVDAQREVHVRLVHDQDPPEACGNCAQGGHRRQRRGGVVRVGNQSQARSRGGQLVGQVPARRLAAVGNPPGGRALDPGQRLVEAV